MFFLQIDPFGLCAFQVSMFSVGDGLHLGPNVWPLWCPKESIASLDMLLILAWTPASLSIHHHSLDQLGGFVSGADTELIHHLDGLLVDFFNVLPVHTTDVGPDTDQCGGACLARRRRRRLNPKY